MGTHGTHVKGGMMVREETYDVVVVGTGAGGLFAALRAACLGKSVLVLEKGAQFGGTSAKSGASLWIPNNDLMASVGTTDSREEAFEYLRTLIDDQISDKQLYTYIDNAPQMLRFLAEASPVQFIAVEGYADYYPDLPGWKSGGRALDALPIDGRPMGKSLYDMVETPRQSKAMGMVAMSIVEGSAILATVPGWKKILARIFLKYFLDIPGRLRGARDRRLTQGNALIGGLWMALRERGVPLWLNAPVKELIREGDRVTGLMVERDGQQAVRVLARSGVVIAAGGFEANQAMREQYLPQPTSAQWSAGNPHNTGDLIRQAMDLGAAVKLMDEAWWAPVFKVDGFEQNFVLFSEKSKPGLILVDQAGKRFMNEAITYNSYGEKFYGARSQGHDCIPAFAIFDSRYRKNYMFGPLLQRSYTPDWVHRRLFQRGLMVKADTLRELALKLDIDPAGLEASAARMKGYAQQGSDEEFHRGDNDHDRYYGDPSVTPNPCLAAIDEPPFYGARIYPGDIGTKGGLVTNTNAQVLDQAGNVIRGLYAIGNSSASIMGTKYPGAGCTLGPAMTFAYLAVNHIAASED